MTDIISLSIVKYIRIYTTFFYIYTVFFTYTQLLHSIKENPIKVKTIYADVDKPKRFLNLSTPSEDPGGYHTIFILINHRNTLI